MNYRWLGQGYQLGVRRSPSGGGGIPPFATINGTVAAWDTLNSTLLQSDGGAASGANDVVGYWSDITGNSLHLLQSSAAVKPSLNATATGVAFNSDWMATAVNASAFAFASGVSQQFSVVVAYSAVNYAINPTWWSLDASTGDAGTGYHFARNLASGGRMVMRRTSNNPNDVQSTTFDATYPTASVFIHTYSGSAHDLYDDNTIISSNSLVQPNSIAFDAFRVANVAESGVIQAPFSIFTLHAAAIYDHVLTPTERATITTDLQSRYTEL